MLKEIYEQQQAITRTVVAYESVPRVAMLEQLALSAKACKALTSISMVAAGTSWHAARIGQFFFESVARIPARVHLASEFRYMPLFVEPSSVCIGISQSGETADTLEALRVLEQTGAVRIGLTNVPSSTILQETEGHLLMHAGPEVSVGSTKAFSTQLATLYWLAHVIAHERCIITDRAYATAIDELLVAASVLEAMLEEYKGVVAQELAPLCAEYDRAIFLGRHISYPFAMEAALKLKEISYIFTQCYPAGELKHGPIALVDQRTPVVLFSVLDPIIYQKLVSNAQEVKARKGNLLVFAFEGQEELIRLADRALVFPRINPLLAPLAMSGVMQLLVYHVALRLGLPIDNPRNLAKSVTVE
jgi:glucosamine--fructose-6-phosphate aminotransferase (isomerizing)